MYHGVVSELLWLVVAIFQVRMSEKTARTSWKKNFFLTSIEKVVWTTIKNLLWVYCNTLFWVLRESLFWASCKDHPWVSYENVFWVSCGKLFLAVFECHVIISFLGFVWNNFWVSCENVFWVSWENYFSLTFWRSQIYLEIVSIKIF